MQLDLLTHLYTSKPREHNIPTAVPHDTRSRSNKSQLPSLSDRLLTKGTQSSRSIDLFGSCQIINHQSSIIMEQHQTPPRHVRFQLLDKENLSSPSSPSFKTPFKSTPRQAPHSTPVPPHSSSKLLRRHFEQISLTPSRRLMESGAVRVALKKTPTTRRPETRRSDRIGYDGTFLTPSKELLRSTAASRNQQVLPLFAQEQEELIARGDHDPVASTLLQDNDDIMEEGEVSPMVSPMSSRLKHWPGLVRPVATKLPR